ncbi:MAG: MopE-related protein, partial [Myxococcota bacterium]
SDATCDGVDDDCDGMTDEDYAPEETSCGTGACASTGTTSCVAGEVTDSCEAGTPAASDATCDGVDDDCDGMTDEDYAPEETSCGTGACASTGTTSCVAGEVTDSCEAGSPAGSDATCDGVDDDCDGTTDEDYAPEETSCGTGACASTGTTSCVAGEVTDSCEAGSPAGSDATCDGVDDDCDGMTDEDYAPEETSCGTGACASTGTTSCVAGEVTDSCTAGDPTGSDADCDGIDDDCDGQVDEGFESVATECGTGACASTGETRCVDGAVTDTCLPGDPAASDDTCDGVDDDCDGVVDEDASDVDGDGVCDDEDTEECDGIDNDGDGEVDEDFDLDGDGYVSCDVTPCQVLVSLGHGEDTFSDPYEYDTAHGWGPAVTLLEDNGIAWEGHPGALTADVLSDYRAVIIAEPLQDFAASEVQALQDFVAAGGGLLLVTDHNEQYMNQVAVPFGVGFLGYGGAIGWVGVNDWMTDAHPVTTGVQSVFWALGSTLALDDPAVEALAWYDGAPVFAQRSYGQGRVVFGADNEIFANYGFEQINDPDPYASRDNEALLLNTVGWLASCPDLPEQDCDDQDATVHPGASDACNGVDDDCDGATDEDFESEDLFCGEGACQALGETACVDGEVVDACEPGEPATADATCDGVDDDCDGATDEDYQPESTSCGVGACAETG